MSIEIITHTNSAIMIYTFVLCPRSPSENIQDEPNMNDEKRTFQWQNLSPGPMQAA